ncbi:NlpC/P60 family protein, partial [Streptacidiphilus monticola]
GNTTPVHDTDHGRYDRDQVYDHAVGPFQFLPATWASDGVNGRGNNAAADPNNAYDAALTAAVELCRNSRDLTQPQQLHDAIYTYNHSDAYVTLVESWITRFDQQATATQSAGSGGYTGKAAVVINAALAEQSVPYSWGGGGAAGPSRGVCCSKGGQDGRTVIGFDCSGLTQYAYAHAGILLPRLAADQARVGRRIPATAGPGALRPGDLIFYAYVPGNDRSIYHVALYLGDNQQIAAPRPGKGVEIEPVATSDYAGGTAIL